MSPQIDGMRVWADFIGLICSDFTPWIYPLAIIQATQEQPPQIGRLVADSREQFRVRAQDPGKGFRAGRGSGNEQRCSRGDFQMRWAHIATSQN